MLTKCLYPVAGYGTRFLPATKSLPKEMLPVVNKPLIQYAVEEAFAAGMTEMAFVTGRTKRAIPDHFDYSYELEKEIEGTGKEKYLEGIRKLIDNCRFTYTRQMQMKGLGHAILTGEPLIGEHPFGVILADDLCLANDHSVMAQMVDIYNEFQCSVVAIQEVSMDDVDKYGVISGDQVREGVYRVNTMVEKPGREEAPSNLAVIGRYILTPDIFDILRTTPPGKGGEIQLTDAIMQQATQGKVIAYKFQGRRFDCGSVEGFVAATNYCFENYYGKE